MKQTLSAAEVRAKVRWGIAGIFVLIVACAVYIFPAYANKAIDAVNGSIALGIPRIPPKSFSLGLDLQGGAQLVYEANVTSLPAADQADSVEGVRGVIERRVNAFGVAESNVQTTKVGDAYRILVELPGVQDITQAIRLIGETPILDFREPSNEPARALTAEEEKQLADFNAEALKKANTTLARVKKGEDFATLAKELSDDTQSKDLAGNLGFVNKRTVYENMYTWAESAKPDQTSQTLIETPLGYHILKRGGERDGAPVIAAKHILFCYLGSQGCDEPLYTKEEARKKAEDIFKEANAKNFSELAKKYSTEPGAAQTGGDLGSFTKGQMVKAFDDAVSAAKAGEIIGPVETEFGYHVIYKISEGPEKEYELSHVFVATKTKDDIVPPNNGWKPTKLSGSQLKRAEVVSDQQTGAVMVSLQFNDEGRDLFREITERNLGKQVGIFLDNNPISAPVVQTVISDGRAVIQGGFTFAEAKLLTQQLNAGALPVPVELVSQQQVGATLGLDSLTLSLKAGLAALTLIAIFMVAVYRLPGLIATLSLALYTVLTLALFKLFGVTLTLSGIAGLILSMGMAIDNNVLIFERLKEELQGGKSLFKAVEEGFDRAWNAIHDGNVSAIITCVVLLWFGSSFVKGFAFVLIIGVFVSMFSAITVTRVILRFMVPWFPEHGNRLFLGAKKRKS